MARSALVTLAIGQNYLTHWQQICAPTWQFYADKYNFDVICLDAPLDTSKRAQERSVAWQKCLIPGQDFAQRYEQIVWLDADILINFRTAPNIVADVPVQKVGAVDEITFTPEGCKMLPRMAKLWPHLAPTIRYSAREYYMIWGLPPCDHVSNTGVLVLSPRHHRELFEHVYYSYDERGGREWHMEQRPLSYQLHFAQVVHKLDPRFNLLWLAQKFLYYPFLLSEPSWLVRKLRRLVGLDRAQAHVACINAAFERSFFLHIGGMQIEEMSLVRNRR